MKRLTLMLISALLSLVLLLTSCASSSAEVIGAKQLENTSLADANSPYQFYNLDHADRAAIAASIGQILEEQNGKYEIKTHQTFVITAEDLAAFLASRDAFERFFGYDAQQLREVFGQGAVLSFDANTPSQAILLEPVDSAGESTVDLEAYLSNAAKTIAAGFAVILVFTTLASLSGGSTFTCAFTCITKVATAGAAANTATDFVIKLAMNLAQGKTLQVAAREAGMDSLQIFADSFLVSAITAGVVVQNLNVCFPANTKILMADGSLRAIQDIKVGDVVACYDIENNKKLTAKVSTTFQNTATERITVHTSNGEISCTPKHPFYTLDHGWISAEELTLGAALMNSEGLPLCVQSLTRETCAEEAVFNIEVEDFHNYFVFLDKSDNSCVLVHNRCDIMEMGAYGKLQPQKGTARHHMPAAKYMVEHGLPMDRCPSIRIPDQVHYKTFSYGGAFGKKGTDLEAFYMALTPDQALDLDLSNLRAILKANGDWTDEMNQVLTDYRAMCHDMYPHLFSAP